jgi:outer membrane protein OmpA-like peptidoglycan-associated protein
MQKLGYPARFIVTFTALLALAVLWIAQPLEPGWLVPCTIVIVLLAAASITWRTRQLSRAHAQSAQLLKELGAATVDIPVNLRTRMPLVLVTGDALSSLFDRATGERRLVFIGDGAIWLRVDRLRNLPHVALATRQWRDGLPPDGVVLCIAPALHTDADALAQTLRVARQARADASRLAGARLPGYVAVYQRMTGRAPHDFETDHCWYGISSATPSIDALRFEDLIRSAESRAQRNAGDAYATSEVAALASIIGWTQRTIFSVLTDPRQPAAPWSLYGAGWIDCGPASGAGKPWEHDVALRTTIRPANVDATPAPWPLPQPLIGAMPRGFRASPRMVACGHAIGITALAASVAFLGAGKHNAALLERVGAHIDRYAAIPAQNDSARRDALQALVSDRDELDRYARTSVPLRLDFGLYHGARLIPALNAAIASYQPPAPPPAVVTLDSMSLFDSGKAQLKPGSTRSLVDALEMIKSHPDKRILVAGYTDNSGNADSNLRLSSARAAALRDWLIDASGIPSTQFAIQGYGDTRPIADNNTDDGRARNRRVEITLVPDSSH